MPHRNVLGVDDDDDELLVLFRSSRGMAEDDDIAYVLFLAIAVLVVVFSDGWDSSCWKWQYIRIL